MTRSRQRRELANPLDALPLLYAKRFAARSTFPPAPEPTSFDRALRRPIPRTPKFVALVSVATGVAFTLAGMLLLDPAISPLSVAPWIGFGVLITVITAAMISVAGRTPTDIVDARPPPPPVVLARSRATLARELRDRSATDPRGAAAQLAALRADWLAALKAAPPYSGRLSVAGFPAPDPLWLRWLMVLRTALPAVVLGLILLDLVDLKGVWFFFAMMAIAFLPTPRTKPWRWIWRRSVAALRDNLCPNCGYHLQGLPPACERLPALGPKLCPECATRWPVAPPLI